MYFLALVAMLVAGHTLQLHCYYYYYYQLSYYYYYQLSYYYYYPYDLDGDHHDMIQLILLLGKLLNARRREENLFVPTAICDGHFRQKFALPELQIYPDSWLNLLKAQHINIT